MAKKSILFSILLMSILLASCSKRVVFEQKHEFENAKWNNFVPVTFKVNINDIESCYNISLNIRHAAQFPYNDIKMLVSISEPSGTLRNLPIILHVKNKDGYFLSTATDDIWELEVKIREYLFFNEKGEYTFTIQNATQYYEMLGFISLGLKVEKAKID